MLINHKKLSPKESIYNLKFISLDGNEINMSDYKGKKILLVNVASRCGFTYQYAKLQELYSVNKDRLVIIGFPCNQFLFQESGSNEDVKNFCSINYNVEFPMSEKIRVKGRNQHPIYSWLTDASKNGFTNSKVKWNFFKYIINEEGILEGIFPSKVEPDNKEFLALI